MVEDRCEEKVSGMIVVDDVEAQLPPWEGVVMGVTATPGRLKLDADVEASLRMISKWERELEVYGPNTESDGL